jgi:hypothetical protein
VHVAQTGTSALKSTSSPPFAPPSFGSPLSPKANRQVDMPRFTVRSALSGDLGPLQLGVHHLTYPLSDSATPRPRVGSPGGAPTGSWFVAVRAPRSSARTRRPSTSLVVRLSPFAHHVKITRCAIRRPRTRQPKASPRATRRWRTRTRPRGLGNTRIAAFFKRVVGEARRRRRARPRPPETTAGLVALACRCCGRQTLSAVTGLTSVVG